MDLHLLEGRVIVDTHPDKGDAFANLVDGEGNSTGDGILLPEGSCRLPKYDKVTKLVSFTPLTMRINAYDLPIGTPVTCLAMRGRRHRWYAAAWAPTSHYNAAKDTYAVFRDCNGEEVEIWRGDVFGLSRHYHSDTWDDGGIIWRSANGREVYSVTKVIVDGTEYYDEPIVDDPRILDTELPPHFLLHHLPRDYDN